MEGQPKAMLYSKDLIDKGDLQQPQILQWKDSSDCFQVQYIKIQDKWFLVICTLKGCQIWNNNGTRQLCFVESKKKLVEGKCIFFTSASAGYDKVDGKEFIAIGTSAGEIYYVQSNGSSFSKDLGFQMTDESAITAMAGDSKSRMLAVGNCNGYIVIFECDTQADWKPLHSIQPPNEIPITSMGTLFRGDNLFVVGFANGIVKLVHPNGFVACEVSAHSRQLNAISCHPSKSVFATCSDDTFLHIFEVSGDKIDKIDVQLLISSRVNDHQLCGVTFVGDTVVCSPYDYKSMTVWNNVL